MSSLKDTEVKENACTVITYDKKSSEIGNFEEVNTCVFDSKFKDATCEKEIFNLHVEQLLCRNFCISEYLGELENAAEPVEIAPKYVDPSDIEEPTPGIITKTLDIPQVVKDQEVPQDVDCNGKGRPDFALGKYYCYFKDLS